MIGDILKNIPYPTILKQRISGIFEDTAYRIRKVYGELDIHTNIK